MSDFIVDKLTKSVGDKTVFRDISFIIHDLDRIGLIGVNGTGKTTLLDVLSGKSGFDGDVSPFSAKTGYKIAYLTQEPDFDEEQTVLDTVLSSDLREMQLIREYELLLTAYDESQQSRLEAVMTEMDSLHAWEIESQVKTVLSKLGLTNLSLKVGQLSGGLRRRVQLAQVLLGDADLLLLDEPTNHLDIDTIEWLTHFLKNSKKTVLFITHDRYFLDNISTRIFELDGGRLIEYQGNYQDYVRLKAEQDERDAALLHKKQQLYKQELSWMRRQPQARATKQQARINRFHDLKKDLADQTTDSNLEMNFETSRIGKKVIEFQNVDFAYDQKPILSQFSLLIQNKDRIGIVGDNGVGKSTLLNLIAGKLQPQDGQLIIGETVRVAYFSQQIEGLDESKRVINYLQEVAEEVKIGSGTTSIAELLEQFLFPRSTHGTLIEKLSGGEKKRLYLLKLLLEKPNVLLLDEPTNDLDIATLTVLENFLQGFAGPVITVSHDRYFLDKVATITLDLTKHSLDRYVGNYSSFVVQKEQKLATEAKNYEKQQKEIAALEDFVNRNLVRASTTKRAQSRRKQLEKMERLDRPETSNRSANMTFKSDKVSGNVVLTLEDAAIGYGEEVLSEPINLDIRKFNAVAIVGPNGIGKTTLIKSLIGQVPFIRGKEQLGANVEVGYYDQTQSKLTPSNTVLDELWNDFKLTPEVEIRNRLGAFLFSGDDVKKSVGMLSGGERARLLLAKLSMENNNFLILDEPTNHLDIDSKEVLENALIDFDGTLLFVSHDRYFINRVATQIIELSEAGSTLYLGDYDYYLEKKAELEALREETEQVDSDKPAPANDYQLQKENQKEQRRLARRLEQLEAQIEDLDSQISQLQEAMQATNDASELMESQQQIDQLTAAQEEAMLEWEELAEKV